MKKFAILHFVIGLVFLILFLLSGVYMSQNFPELYSGREEIRMMYRATHIYILMSALLNLITGSYLLNLKNPNFVKIRVVASGLIYITPVLFSIAYIYEPPAYLIDRPITFWTVLCLFSGVMLHSLLSLNWFSKK